MKNTLVIAAALASAGCSGPTWPKEHFLEEMEIKRTLFAGGGFGFRESCDALVVELTDASATRLVHWKRTEKGLEVVPPGEGWNMTPIVGHPDRPAFEGAFGGCSSSGGRPLGDLPGALRRPGGLYKILNGGEAILIIVPRAKLAGFFNFG